MKLDRKEKWKETAMPKACCVAGVGDRQSQQRNVKYTIRSTLSLDLHLVPSEVRSILRDGVIHRKIWIQCQHVFVE